MDLQREGKYYHFMERSPIWLGISAFLILLGITFMIINQISFGAPFRLSIHFTGGEKIILKLANPVPLDGQAVAKIVQSYSEGEAIVQVNQQDPRIVTMRLRFPKSSATGESSSKVLADQLTKLKMDLGNAYGGYRSNDDADPNPVTMEEASVGPTVRAELIRNAAWALVIGSLLIMIYIFARFGRMTMSAAAVLALVHDVMITLGLTAVFRLEVSDSYIAVVLTIIGYSINDTIIIFDRIRENLRKYGSDVSFAQLINLSISQTFLRSVNTVATVVFMILMLIFFGGVSIREFMIAMLIGIIAGCYSSIYIAPPLMLWFTRGKLMLEPETGPGITFTPATPDFSVPEAEADEPDLEDASGRPGSSAARRKGGKIQRRR